MNSLGRVKSSFFIIIVVASLSGIIYHNRQNFQIAYHDLRLAVGIDKPCDRPILYSIGQYDQEFGLDRSEFLQVTAEATALWDAAAGKKLFAYSDKADLKVNLIYDSRQKATQELQKIDSTIDGKTGSYDQWKTRYESQKAEVARQKSALEFMTASYKSRQSKYERQVAQSNSRGGASGQDYEALERERLGLNAESTIINAAVQKFNAAVDQLNVTADMLNTLGKDINRNVSKYNEVSVSNGAEFGEGEYIRDQNGERINIYQYDDRNKLFRVLAHEFGHAIGLEHASDPAAVMYMINKSDNRTLTAEDIAAINLVCSK